MRVGERDVELAQHAGQILAEYLARIARGDGRAVAALLQCARELRADLEQARTILADADETLDTAQRARDRAAANVKRLEEAVNELES